MAVFDTKPKAGYMGIAVLGGHPIRCTSFNVNPQQKVLFYDHVIGLKDTVPSDSSTKGENTSDDYRNVQQKIWRPSTITISGGMAFPSTENTIGEMFELAKNASYFDMDMYYYCKPNSRIRYGKCRVNSYDFSVTAGDIVNTSVEIQAMEVEETSGDEVYSTAEKIVNDCIVSVVNAPFDATNLGIQQLQFKINNNVQPIHLASSLYPSDLRVGMQSVQGSLSVFLKRGQRIIETDTDTISKIRVEAGPFNFTLTVVFETSPLEGQVGPVVTQLPFVGVDKYFE